MEKELAEDCVRIEIEDDSISSIDGAVELSEEQHKKLLHYLTSRLDKSQTRRMRRLTRYAKMDQRVTTWMKLSPEDSVRLQVEDDTGRSQAIPMNLPILQSHIDDTVSFFCEVFAPLGGNFYAVPSDKEKSPQLEELASMMNRDTKINSYYSQLAFGMRQLCKFNINGFEVYWNPGNTKGVGGQTINGNVVEAIDVYNAMWDESVEDVCDIAKKAEWAARPMVRNRLWFMKQAMAGTIINADKVLGGDPDKERYGNTSLKTLPDETNAYNVAKWYRNPPGQTNMDADGSDSKTAQGDVTGSDINWDAFGLGLKEDTLVGIEGHEVVRMYCWINPNQFELVKEAGADGRLDSIELWRFLIVDGTIICLAEPVKDATEIPMYFGRVNKDNMRDTMRSISELQVSFQRFISFLFNTHVEGTRGAIWGTKVYDPTAIDASGLKKGDVAGLLASKVPGRDVRTAIAELRSDNSSTRTNLQDAATTMDFMKTIFPNQSLPSQIASMDRAVSSQVSAVMQGTMRKMHMLVRIIDADQMLATRQEQYRNLAANDEEAKKLNGINEEDVADLLSSGLGQLNREAAAAQLHDLIFAIIQNQEAMATFDLAALFRAWSLLTNTGIDLGEYVKQQAPAPTDPNATQPGAAPADPSQQPPIPQLG